ncbi:hypothetical protein AB833_00165 [Chromatiales bacterium (ex Bugula neritina AB1)]|nr:hypothetical protein AB833_00165 [Chromatiales bacterium (ex Bugula neritina AB1)]
MKTLIFSALLVLSINLSVAETTEADPYYVTANALNVRLSPKPNGKITNKIYRQQEVEVFEIKSNWARVSKYYDGSVEGVTGKVARWVSKEYLSKSRPKDLVQPPIKTDPRIRGLPKVGEYGATKRDVEVLYFASHHFLEMGKCKTIEFGDKSVSKSGVYYLNCGGPSNLFFKPSDIPGLK